MDKMTFPCGDIVIVMMMLVITKVRLGSDEKHINHNMMIINAGAAPWQ